MSQTPKSSAKKRSPSASTTGTGSRKSAALVPLNVGREPLTNPFVQIIEPQKTKDDVVLSPDNKAIFTELLQEFRKGDQLRRHGMRVKSRLLFCGPPGCGKTITAEAFAYETGLDLMIIRIDALISSFLGETASNLKTVFEAVERKPYVLFFDEFDALGRTRSDPNEHSEIRRVVNSLLIMIERFAGRGFIIAATNLEHSLDPAIWRRFDEVIYFDAPNLSRVKELLALKTRSFGAAFDLAAQADKLTGFSYADIERVVETAIKSAIMSNRKRISEEDFAQALNAAQRRNKIQKRLNTSD